MSSGIGASGNKNISQFNSVFPSAKVKVAPATDKPVDGQSPEIKEGPALAKPAAGSTPEKPSLTMSANLKEVGLFLKSALTTLAKGVLGTVAGAVAIPTAVVAGVVMAGGALASAAGSTSSFAAGSRSILSSIPSALGKTKAPKEQASPETINKHKASTESQLTVALENFKLAARKLGIPEGKINSKADDLEKTITANIAKKYTQDCDLNSVNKEFRNKHDDFGLTSELATLLRLQSGDKGEMACKAASKSAMKETKPAAIDTVGQTKAKKGFSSDIKVGESTYKTEIKMQTTDFVSSASSKANGNTCGNLNLQTLRGADGTVLFKTLRHAALTAKPAADETKDPLNINQTAAETVTSLCEKLNSGDIEKVGKATQELKKYGINAEEFRDKRGSVDASKLTKKMAKQCGLLNKALDVGKSAWAAQGNPSGKVNITSLSLMTPDRPRAGLDGKGGEVGKLKDQVEAFKLLQNLESTDLVGMGIGSAETPVTFNVMTFNFGVNEGESLGRGLQKEYNKEAMTKLNTLTTEKLKNLDHSLKTMTDGPGKTKLTVEKATIEALSKDIEKLHAAYIAPPSDSSKGLWRADQAYNLTAKISFLTELCDGVNTCNCASGKDRTGMHVANSLNYAGLMRDRMAASTPGSADVKSTWEMITGLTNSDADKPELQALQALQKRNGAFMLETGQHEVQEWNTGSAGYKLYSDTLPNMLTRGGQTESYFMTMFGGTKADVANTVTMQAKYNAT